MATTEAEAAYGSTPVDLASVDAAAPGLGRALMDSRLTGEVAPPMTEMDGLGRLVLSHALLPHDHGSHPYDEPEDGKAAMVAAHERRVAALAGSDIEPPVDCLFRTGGLSHQRPHPGMPGLAETPATDPPAVVAAVDKLEPEARLAMIGHLGTSVLVERRSAW